MEDTGSLVNGSDTDFGSPMGLKQAAILKQVSGLGFKV